MMVKWDKNYFSGEVMQLITAYHVTGLLLHKGAWTKEQSLAKFTRYSQYYARIENPLLIATAFSEKENKRLSQMTPLPSQKDLRKVNNRLYTRQIAEVAAEEHRKLGINVLIGPSLHLDDEDEQSFGMNIDEAYKHGVAMIQGFKKGNVACAITGITKQKDPLQRVDSKKSELYPFYIAVQENAPLIHIHDLDDNLIRQTILEDLQFNGVIAFEVASEQKSAEDVASKIVEAIASGVHLIILKDDYKQQVAILNKVIEKVKKGEVSKEKLLHAVEKINELKKNYAISNIEECDYLTLQTRHAIKLANKIATSLASN